MAARVYSVVEKLDDISFTASSALVIEEQKKIRERPIQLVKLRTLKKL